MISNQTIYHLLPNEILTYILFYESPDDLINLRNVNTFFNIESCNNLYMRNDLQSIRYQKKLIDIWFSYYPPLPLVNPHLILERIKYPEFDLEYKYKGLLLIANKLNIPIEKANSEKSESIPELNIKNTLSFKLSIPILSNYQVSKIFSHIKNLLLEKNTTNQILILEYLNLMIVRLTSENIEEILTILLFLLEDKNWEIRKASINNIHKMVMLNAKNLAISQLFIKLVSLLNDNNRQIREITLSILDKLIHRFNESETNTVIILLQEKFFENSFAKNEMNGNIQVSLLILNLVFKKKNHLDLKIVIKLIKSLLNLQDPLACVETLKSLKKAPLSILLNPDLELLSDIFILLGEKNTDLQIEALQLLSLLGSEFLPIQIEKILQPICEKLFCDNIKIANEAFLCFKNLYYNLNDKQITYVKCNFIESLCSLESLISLDIILPLIIFLPKFTNLELKMILSVYLNNLSEKDNVFQRILDRLVYLIAFYPEAKFKQIFLPILLEKLKEGYSYNFYYIYNFIIMISPDLSEKQIHIVMESVQSTLISIDPEMGKKSRELLEWMLPKISEIDITNIFNYLNKLAGSSNNKINDAALRAIKKLIPYLKLEQLKKLVPLLNACLRVHFVDSKLITNKIFPMLADKLTHLEIKLIFKLVEDLISGFEFQMINKGIKLTHTFIKHFSEEQCDKIIKILLNQLNSNLWQVTDLIYNFFKRITTLFTRLHKQTIANYLITHSSINGVCLESCLVDLRGLEIFLSIITEESKNDLFQILLNKPITDHLDAKKIFLIYLFKFKNIFSYKEVEIIISTYSALLGNVNCKFDERLRKSLIFFIKWLISKEVPETIYHSLLIAIQEYSLDLIQKRNLIVDLILENKFSYNKKTKEFMNSPENILLKVCLNIMNEINFKNNNKYISSPITFFSKKPQDQLTKIKLTNKHTLPY